MQPATQFLAASQVMPEGVVAGLVLGVLRGVVRCHEQGELCCPSQRPAQGKPGHQKLVAQARSG